MTADNNALVTLTAEIVSAHVTHNAVAVADLPTLIGNIYTALAKLDAAPAATASPEQKLPAVPVRNSIKPGHLVCLEDGKHYKTLKKHLATDHQLTPDQYRAKWSLPTTYPMVAPDYTAARRATALRLGLGRPKTVEAEFSAASPVDSPVLEAATAATTSTASPPRTRKPRLKIAIG